LSAWLRLHVHAFADALARIAAQPWASVMSILVLATAITLPVIAAVALRSAGAAAASLDTDPHINVYLALDAGDEDVRRIERALRSQPDALTVKFVPRAQALQELKATTHLAEILAALDRNPLPHAFTVRVRTTAADRVAAMRSEWSRLPKVDQVLADFEWSGRLARWVRFGERLLWVMAGALGVAVAFIVGHLIRLQVLTRREEIQVSQLIGATAADVRRPFLHHGLLQGALAGAAAVGLAGLLAHWAGIELSALTPGYTTELKVVFLTAGESLIAMATAAALGLAGAWLAVTREIRRFAAG
jgi:cell division transport system permease protein